MCEVDNLSLSEQLPLGKDVEKSKEELTDFLNTILRDKLLRQSEGVYR